jgi:hypothetical protein
VTRVVRLKHKFALDAMRMSVVKRCSVGLSIIN